jgi:hypothetical protein
MRHVAVFLAVAACTIPIVPTERLPIRWVQHGRHGGYEKGGVELAGTTCGEQFQRAVSGVPEAEAMMARCHTGTMVYAAGMLGFLVLPGAAAATYVLTGSGTVHDAAFPVGFSLGMLAFGVGYIATFWASARLDDAVEIYDAAP